MSDGSGGCLASEWDMVPSIVRQCIRHLEITGLQTLGVFRVSPSKKRVRQVCIPLIIDKRIIDIFLFIIIIRYSFRKKYSVITV